MGPEKLIPEYGCHRLAEEVERLQPIAEKVALLEAKIEAHQQELAGVREEQESQEASPLGLPYCTDCRTWQWNPEGS